MSRNTVLAALVALSVAALAVFGGADRPSQAGQISEALPRADAEGALSSSWFCPSGQGGPANDLTTVIDVANTSSSARTGTVTWLGAADGKTTMQAFTVAPGTVKRLRAVEAGPTPVASALVEAVGGGIVVEQVVAGARGNAIAPCSSDGSSAWYLANGSTLVDATQVLTLFNPFPGDAVVDIEFATAKGRVAPSGVQGYVIPAGRTRFIDMTTLGGVLREEVTAAALRARTGRLVVGRLQSFDGTQGRSGVAFALAARSTAQEWVFAIGGNAPDRITQWHVFNPGPSEAQVSIEVMPVSGDTPEPIDLTVPPRSQVVVPAAREGGVEANVNFASVVRSSNGVAIVAELSVEFRAPNARRGWSSAFGTTTPGARWSFATGDTRATSEAWLVVFNPGSVPRAVGVTSLTPTGRVTVASVQGAVVPPASLFLVRLSDVAASSQFGLDIEADGPVVVERLLLGSGSPGVSEVAAIAVPPR